MLGQAIWDLGILVTALDGGDKLSGRTQPGDQKDSGTMSPKQPRRRNSVNEIEAASQGHGGMKWLKVDRDAQGKATLGRIMTVWDTVQRPAPLWEGAPAPGAAGGLAS